MIDRVQSQIYKPAMKRADHDSAMIVNRCLITAQPWKSQFRLDQLALGLAIPDPKLMSAAFETLSTLPRDHVDAQSKALKSLLQAGHTELAADFSRVVSHHWIASAQLCHLSIKALHRTGQREAAAKAARTLAQTGDISVDVVVEAAITLIAMRQFKDVDALAQAAGLQNSAHPLGLALLALTWVKLGRDQVAVFDLAQKAHELAPQDPRVLGVVAEIFEFFGDIPAALGLITAVEPDVLTPTLLERRAKLWSLQGDHAQAARDYSALWENAQTNRALTRKFIGALAKSGQADRAKIVYDTTLRQRAVDLGPTFKDALDRVGAAEPLVNIPEHRFAWVEKHINPALAKDKSWRGLAQLSADVDQTILDWVECHPEKVGEITPFIDATPEAQTLLNVAAAEGKGAFITSAHIGVLYAGPVALEKLGYASKWIASMPDVEGQGQDGRLISTQTGSISRVVKATLTALAANKIVAVAIDGAAGHKMRSALVFDANIQLSDFCVQLSFKNGTPCFFPKIIWNDSHVEIDLVAMPLSNKGETYEIFRERWVCEFTKNIEIMLKKSPHAFRGSGGFWRDVRD